MKHLKITLLILVAMQGFLFNQNFVAEGEEAPAVIINEIGWAGTSLSISDEFVELYNTTNYDINMSNWKIKGAATSGSDLILPATSTIPALGFFIVANYPPDSEKSASEIEADFISSSISLANSDAEYQLLDSENILIDEADDGSGAPFAGNNETKASMARKPGCWDGGLEECWFTSHDQINLKPDLPDLATPGADNNWQEPIINLTPTAVIDAPATSEVNIEIIFDGQNSFDPEENDLSYTWHLNDELVATNGYYLSAFSKPATYEIWLTVSDGELEDTTSTKIIIYPEPEPPYVPSFQDILINEFVPNPKDGNEWIEIYNHTTNIIDLNEWKLWDAKSSVYSFDATLAPDELYVAELSSAKLNNSGDQIFLMFGEVIIDSVTYGDWEDGDVSDNVPFPGQSLALARPFGAENFEITTTPTPNEKNIITPIPEPKPETIPEPESGNQIIPIPDLNEQIDPEPESTPSFNPGDLIINEFISNPPPGGVEWVEIYNPGAKINLTDWRITDGSATATHLESEIKSNGYITIFSPRGKLNNDEDTISLIDPSNNLIDTITYGYELPAPPKGTALARDGFGFWQITHKPTPGRGNEFVLPDSEPEPNKDESEESTEETKKESSASKSKKETIYAPSSFAVMDTWQEGQNISITGVVTALPGTLGAQLFYLGDMSGRGVQIYNYKKEFPALGMNDKIYVQGELTKTYNMWRIKTKSLDDFYVLGDGESEPWDIKVDEIDYEYFGALAVIEGEVTEFKKSYLYIDDGSGEIKINFAKSNALENIKLSNGDMIRATGIITPTKSEIRLETRLPEDIEIKNQTSIDIPDETDERPTNNWVGLIPLGILMVVGIANLKKLKKLVKK